jgi:hypothetical protein
MSDLHQCDGAGVVVLRVPAQANETRAREIGALFPGWHVWYSDWSDTWDAYREGEQPYFWPGAVAGRAFMVSAYNASDLVALLENQARIAIAVEFPDWRVRQGLGGWCAIFHQGPQSSDGTVVQLMHGPGIRGGAVDSLAGALALAVLEPAKVFVLVGGTRFELVTSSVSGKRSPAELTARDLPGGRRSDPFAALDAPCLAERIPE